MASGAPYIFGCTHCQRSFESRGRMNRHLKTHTKPFRCRTCDRGFALRLDLQRHVKARHRLANETFPCRERGCGFRAARKDNLRQHQDRVHGRISDLNPIETVDEPGTTQSHNERDEVTANPSTSMGVEPGENLEHRALFFQAAAAGNTTVLQAFLDRGISIETKADDGSTALHCAAKAGQASTVMRLVQQRADTLSTNRKGRTPLDEAILGKDIETINFLLTARVKLHINDVTALCIVQSGSLDILNLWIDHLGVALSEKEKYNLLLIASEYGQKSILARLLSLTEDSGGNDSTDYYCQLAGRNLPWARQLFRNRKFSPLFVTAGKGDLETTELLVEHGFKVNGLADHYTTPLCVAASKGHANVVRYLLSRKDVEVNRKPAYAPSNSLLHILVVRGEMEMIKHVLNREDIAVNSLNAYGRAALHLAAASGCLPVLRLLLMDKRVDRNAKDHYGLSVLQLSAIYGHWEMVQTLLDQQSIETADENVTQSEEKEPVAPSKLIERLLSQADLQDVNVRGCWHDDKNAMVGGLLHVAVRQGDCDTLRFLLNRKNVNVNLQSAWTACTPLHLAVHLGRFEMAKLLLQHGGINTNLRCRPFSPIRRLGDETAIQMAKRLGHMDLVELLLEHGAHHDEASALGLRDIDGSEVKSNTPMHHKDGTAELELEMEASLS